MIHPFTSLLMIANERGHQLDLGYDAAHDDGHDGGGDLIAAANCYALFAWWQTEGDRCGWTRSMVDEIILSDDAYLEDGVTPNPNRLTWPWDEREWHPSATPVENLVKAGALIAAAIDWHLRGAALK